MDNKEFSRDLIRRSFNFAKKIISLIDKLPKKSSTQIIANQLLRAATSIGANIIEAQAACSRKDFANFLNHSLKSANETKFWLALLMVSADSNLRVEIKSILNEANELAKILGSIISTLKGKRKL